MPLRARAVAARGGKGSNSVTATKQNHQTDQERQGMRVYVQRRGEGRGRRRVLLGAAAAGAAGLAGAAWWWTSAGHSSASAADIQDAAALAGAPPSAIEPLTSGIHVVDHATTPLPSATRPRADGKVTLVWFSATW